ncbi:hypothetical protein AM231_25810 [Paenibacillus solani]|uniref:DUF5050 domain-containing protein n=2 Tax=Paenibacillus solani TaxID=1705565 RepID=A0A0M1N1N0_9BACL|nr:hypothetical protein AM231_25810 [Paenibacillus solani]
MKNHFITWLTLLFLIAATGCTGSEYPKDDNFQERWDYPLNFRIQGHGLLMTDSEKGYYFVDKNLIYYMDKDSKNPVLLDNRPDHRCMNKPDSSNCYAYIQSGGGSYPTFIQYYDSKLYVLESYWDIKSKRSMFDDVWKISRMDPDGKNRKEFKRFDSKPNFVAIHRGYLYFSLTSADKDNVQTTKVMRMQMEGKHKEEVIYEDTGPGANITDIVPYGQQLYIISWSDKGYEILRYDLETKEVTAIADRKDVGGSTALQDINGQNLYLSYFYGIEDDERSRVVYSTNLRGEQIHQLKLNDPLTLPLFFKDNLYSYFLPLFAYAKDLPEGAPYEMAIYKDNKVIHRVNLMDLPNMLLPIPGDEKYMFLRYENPNTGFMILDKSLIESGKAKFEPLLEGEEPELDSTKSIK